MKEGVANLFFISGPQGAGKTTLAQKISELDARIIIPHLLTHTPKFHTNPLERITLKICQRAIENYEAGEIAMRKPDNVILANRCVYDARAYAKAYWELGWIDMDDLLKLSALQDSLFQKDPTAIIYNPPLPVVKERLKLRWKMGEKKWREDDEEYLRFSCKAYHELYGKMPKEQHIFYTSADPHPKEILTWMYEESERRKT